MREAVAHLGRIILCYRAGDGASAVHILKNGCIVSKLLCSGKFGSHVGNHKADALEVGYAASNCFLSLRAASSRHAWPIPGLSGNAEAASVKGFHRVLEGPVELAEQVALWFAHPRYDVAVGYANTHLILVLTKETPELHVNNKCGDAS